MTVEGLEKKIINGDYHSFEEIALQIYDYQRIYNPIYSQYVTLLHKDKPLSSIQDIPFLPIAFFKSHSIASQDWVPERIFESSGTTGQIPSKHGIRSLTWYHQMATVCFEQYFGALSQYEFAGLLPHYLERPNSSLVEMVNYFMTQSESQVQPYFFTRQGDQLFQLLQQRKAQKKRMILFGLSFALYDFAMEYSLEYPELIIIETGGMKTDSRVIVKEDIFSKLHSSFPLSLIRSEYGMTELHSQLYSNESNYYVKNKNLHFSITDVTDPFTLLSNGRRGQINVIDLGNIHTCSFIQTEDMGIQHEDGSLEVLGRLQESEIRGCNSMYS